MQATSTGTRSSEWVPGCLSVLDDVLAERHQQVARYGLQHGALDHGTGPGVQWLEPYTKAGAAEIEGDLRTVYEQEDEANGKPTRLRLLLEEVSEAFQEEPGQALYDELKQVAALAVSQMEDLKAAGLAS
jgi:hypothetical protein